MLVIKTDWLREADGSKQSLMVHSMKSYDFTSNEYITWKVSCRYLTLYKIKRTRISHCHLQNKITIEISFHFHIRQIW